MINSPTVKRWLAASATVLAVGGGGTLAMAQSGGHSNTAATQVPNTQRADTPERGDRPDAANERSEANDVNEARDANETNDLERADGKIGPDPHLGQTEPGARRADPEVARQHEEQPARDGGAANRRDHRFWAGKQAQEAHVQTLDDGVLRIDIEILRLLQVKSGREYLERARQNDCPNPVVGGQFVDRRRESHQEFRAQRVHRAAIQHDFDNPARMIAPDQPIFFAHIAPCCRSVTCLAH